MTPFIRGWPPKRRAKMAPLPPELSASTTMTRSQIKVVLVASFLALGLLVVQPLNTLTATVGVITAVYIAAFLYRLRLFWGSVDQPEIIRIDDAMARAIPYRELPIYTILVPAYREPEVIGRLLDEIDRIEYPQAKLDVKLLLEADDRETLDAVLARPRGPHIQVVRIADAPPKTKPKACNVGLASARGRYVTIYDAEDRPDPLQLRRAVAAFKLVEPEVACLQAKLAYYNADQNLITRWFAVEYFMWFNHLLPGLVARRAPLPLGGTSNHFRLDVLAKVGGWDPHNVTEDADLGIRLHRAGYRTEVIDSETLEEANSDFINWVKQRSRWYKGYLQTWLVHMRHPGKLLGEVGLRGFIGFNLFVGGTPLLALLNPVFWAMAVLWFLAEPAWIGALFPSWLYYAAGFCLVVGNSANFYTTLVSARMTGRPGLVLAALLVPLYWVMMSVAAIKAVAQLLSSPSFWEKTAHGLDRRVAVIGSPAELERPAA
jgi:cellulose synthase/poly-beta-1,6-N-acetylglucosamine synthase-like glycosyltransferase